MPKLLKLTLKIRASIKYFILTLLILSGSEGALAWGGRGHAAICEAAVFLVKNPQLKEYLQNKPQMMGHLCNIPDIYWKTLPSEQRKLGDAGHFINAENLGLKIKDIPTDYKQIIETYTGKEITTLISVEKAKTAESDKPTEQKTITKKIINVPEELGSNWWRADQFFRRAIADGAALKEATAPQNFKEEQNENLDYNKHFYSLVVNLGLMGHFIGDASQPFHSTSDYDGYAVNHGGIHTYYEDSAVAFFDASLVNEIVKQAQKMPKPAWVKQKTLIENMRLFSELAVNDLKQIIQLDPVTKPSELKTEKGMKLKTPAERQDASVGHKKFKKLIMSELTRSSYLLAHLWDQAYEQAGKPSIKAYKSYRYPLTPEFVNPDYFTIESKTSTDKGSLEKSGSDKSASEQKK